MASGRQNRLTGQIAEHLVCAELGRRGLIATPFAGNVPTFDVIAVNDRFRSVPIQVKATTAGNWPTDARQWMDLCLEESTGIQHYHGPLAIAAPELVYVCVALRPTGDARRDQFFILTKADIQRLCIDSYTNWMVPRGWRRPRTTTSFDCRYTVEQLQPFENNWSLIEGRLAE